MLTYSVNTLACDVCKNIKTLTYEVSRFSWRTYIACQCIHIHHIVMYSHPSYANISTYIPAEVKKKTIHRFSIDLIGHV